MPQRARKRQTRITAEATRRINIRASAEQESLIREAARRRGENLADFMLRSACIEAEMTLSEKHNFQLSPERWKSFVEILDQPPVIKPQLRKLFSEPSILERSR